MFEQITAADATGETWDVVIAGSSFAAMFFLYGLDPSLRVLIVEKGTFRDHAAQIRDGQFEKETFSQTNTSGRTKDWVSRTGFGGNSNCWWGQTPRFHPADFELARRYGVGQDWPLGYDALEPYYGDVEEIMEIAGGGTDAILPRSRPFPFPPHTLSRSDEACLAAFPDAWVPSPTARSNGGSRAICCTNGACFLCPVDAKFTILNSVERFLRPNVALLLDHEVESVVTDGSKATGVRLTNSLGEVMSVSSRSVALATNAMNNALILLRSGVESPSLGRFLHEQASVFLEIDTDFPGAFGGSSITSHSYAEYDGPHRSESAAVLIENYTAPMEFRFEPGKWTHRMKLKFIAEDLPQAENRVQVGPDGRPQITWVGHHPYAFAGLKRAVANLPRIAPVTSDQIVRQHSDATEAHIQGTHRMGQDAATSVVDAGCRMHALGNVWALGAGAFPSASPANPTLTLSALSLRAGRLFS